MDDGGQKLESMVGTTAEAQPTRRVAGKPPSGRVDSCVMFVCLQGHQPAKQAPLGTGLVPSRQPWLSLSHL